MRCEVHVALLQIVVWAMLIGVGYSIALVLSINSRAVAVSVLKTIAGAALLAAWLLVWYKLTWITYRILRGKPQAP